MSQLLIIEDNQSYAQGLTASLRSDGFDVLLAHDGMEGVRLAREGAPDLVVLDLMLPGRDGYDVLRMLRDEGNDVLVLVLTARRDEQDKVRSYGLGADEYVTKPVGILELTARIRAVLRRAQPVNPPADAWVHVGDLAIQPSTRSVRRAGQDITLRRKEYDLLLALVRHQGRIVSREELLREVWGYHPDIVSRTVDTHILALRHKLEADPMEPRRIMTSRSAGYFLKP